MKILVVRGIKIFFLLFFSYINKNFSCDCCDECWKNFSPDKKTSSKYSDKNKKLDIPSIIEEEKEEGENQGEKEEGNEEENKEENEEENEEERIKREEEERKKKEEEEERKKKEEEEDKKEEEENKDYLESLLKDIKKVKILKGDFFFTEKKDIYEKGRELGKGGFGSVYKIQNKKNGKFFALKQIVTEKTNIIKIIQKEIQNMILLRNEKNIVKIFDVYRQDNFVGNFLKKIYSKKDNAVCFYIIMEFCENGDLYDFIENKKIFDKENLRDKIAYQIINAVHSCYKNNIVHRDLKPLNIFLDKDWNVKLGDFGLSDKFEYNEDSSRCGTLNYMCYEIILEIKHNPFKADLYSLGVILYELYTEISYSKGEHKPHSKSYKEGFYKNGNVEHKLNNNLDDENYYNLKILLTGLLKQLDVDRWGWKNIFESEFYKSLDKKYKE